MDGVEVVARQGQVCVEVGAQNTLKVSLRNWLRAEREKDGGEEQNQGKKY